MNAHPSSESEERLAGLAEGANVRVVGPGSLGTGFVTPELIEAGAEPALRSRWSCLKTLFCKIAARRPRCVRRSATHPTYGRGSTAHP
jgi:hypothetical protein